MRRDRHKRKPEGQDNLQDDTFHSAEDSVARLMFGLNFMRLPNLTGASRRINTSRVDVNTGRRSACRRNMSAGFRWQAKCARIQAIHAGALA